MLVTEVPNPAKISRIDQTENIEAGCHVSEEIFRSRQW
jgi:hypothetical protein